MGSLIRIAARSVGRLQATAEIARSAHADILALSLSVALGVAAFGTPALAATPTAAPSSSATTSAPASTTASSSNSAPISSATSSNSSALVSQITAALARPKGIRTRFTQTQTRAALKQPLVSSGSLVFVRERGAVWQIEKPYQATWVIDDRGVTELDAQGHRVAGASAQGARGAAQISAMMRSMLSGDLSALYSQFDVRADGTLQHWQIELTPNQPQIAQAIQSLTMTGADSLHSLRVTTARGETVQFDFADTTPITDLSPAERALFEAPR